MEPKIPGTRSGRIDLGLFSTPPQINSQGSVLSDEDKDSLYGKQGFVPGDEHRKSTLSPTKQAEMLLNWLTAGGPPKKVDPSATFKESQDTAGIRSKASAGQGINGLFGIGNLIGDLTPKVEGIKPIKMIEPINQSPMQPGVPYSAIPVAGGK